MNRWRVVRWAVIGCAALLVLPCGFFGFWFAVEAGSDRGSPALAQEWQAELTRYADPDAARAADPEVIVVRCRNGEWVFGRSKSSHGIWYRGGGTVVVRDSSGQTRAFFGHVCGNDVLGAGSTEWTKPPNLSAYYERLEEYGFVEYPLP